MYSWLSPGMQACSEFELFKGIIAWAPHRGSVEDISSELTELLPLVRFPVMLPQELQVSSFPQVLCQSSSTAADTLHMHISAGLCTR